MYVDREKLDFFLFFTPLLNYNSDPDTNGTIEKLTKFPTNYSLILGW